MTRGLPASHRIGALTPSVALRATLTHFRGLAERWLDVDRETADVIVRRMREERPDFLFAAFTGVDKASHARGHDDPLVHEAMRIVDDATARLRADAEQGGEPASATPGPADLVEQPAKVMRIGGMIRQLLEAVKSAPLDEASRSRLREIPALVTTLPPAAQLSARATLVAEPQVQAALRDLEP